MARPTFEFGETLTSADLEAAFVDVESRLDIRLANRGDWSASAAYIANDVAFRSNAYWIALLPSTNSEPSASNANWRAFGGGDSDFTGTLGAEQIGDGSVSDIEYSMLNGVTSPIQTQLDNRVLESEVVDFAQDAFEAGDNVTFGAGTGGRLKINAAQDLTATLVSDEATVTTSVLAAGASETVQITLGKAADMDKVTTSSPAWLRLYPRASAVALDSARSINEWYEGQDLVFDVLTRDGLLYDNLNGGIRASSTESPRANIYPLVVQNTSATAQAITVSIQKMTLEI